MVLIHSAVLKDDSKDLPYKRYTALAAVCGTDSEISVHRFTVSKELWLSLITVWKEIQFFKRLSQGLHNRCGSNSSELSQGPPIDVLCGSEQCAINVLRARYVFNWFEEPATTDICSSGRFTDHFRRLLNIPSWHNSVQSAPRVVCFELRQATLTSRLSGDKFPTYLPLPQTVYL